jgi:aspartate racemase
MWSGLRHSEIGKCGHESTSAFAACHWDGLNVIVPDDADRAIVHRVIYEELCLGEIRDESRDEYRRIIAKLVERGAQAIILGCTEISLLVVARDATVPLFDTTRLHAEGAAPACLG